jgi:phosphomannomutase
MKQYQIKFGTDGWRALIAREFSVENVARVGKGIAAWLKHLHPDKKQLRVIIGYDTRFGGKLFSESLAISLIEEGIYIDLSENFVTTPMISLATLEAACDLGIIFTASHNPPAYQGLKIKANYGGPAVDSMVEEIVALIPERIDLPMEEDYKKLQSSSLVRYLDLEALYTATIRKRFDLEALRKDQKNYLFDAMNGSIQNYIQKLFPEMNCIRVDPDPTFKGVSPEPIEKNMLPLREALRNGNYALGLAVDGDADRIGLMDGQGKVIDSHHIMLILIWYLVKYKGQSGKVVTGFSSTQKIKTLCKKLGLELEIVKIGFKHAAAIMLKDDVLLAGEEAGGIATKGHIPERDGLWNILLIMEMLHSTGKTMAEIQLEIEEEVGAFDYSRLDLSISRDKIDSISQQLKKAPPASFASKKVAVHESLDGNKFYFNDDEWLMFRASGTEPLLRIYAESSNKENALALIELGRNYFKV